MDKYLLEILKNINTIIIPGLGALTITDHDTGEIMFMSYLKHDDGKLVNYIVENEGMEELEAKNLIAKYVREIQLTIDKGESYDMFQFGSFFKNNDEIDFRNWGESKEDSENETNKEPIIAPVINKTPIIEEKEVEEIIPPKTEEEIKPLEKTEPVVLHLKEEEKELNILEKEERAATAEKLEVLRKNQGPKNERNKKGVGFWMLLVLLALIAGGGTYFGMNYDKLKQHVPFLADASPFSTGSNISATVKNDNTMTTENSNTATDKGDKESDTNYEVESEVIEEAPELEEDIIEPEVKETSPNNSNNDLLFHIIAGAFGSEENANRLGEKFKTEGYNVKVGPGRGMTLVSINSFATKSEAQAALNELKDVAPNGWVYEWK